LRACTTKVSQPVAATADVVLLLVDAEPALDRDRDRHRRTHRRDAIGDQRRFAHQAGAETPRLDPIGRAADIEVDLVEPLVLRDPRRRREQRGFAAAQLQRERPLVRRKAQQAMPIAVQHRIGMHHLGVEPRARREHAMEIAAVAVGPIHHRRDREARRLDIGNRRGEVSSVHSGWHRDGPDMLRDWRDAGDRRDRRLSRHGAGRYAAADFTHG
jgi:hypothetical protein